MDSPHTAVAVYSTALYSTVHQGQAGSVCVKHKLINIFAALHSVRAESQISLYTALKAAIALSDPQLRISLHNRLP